MGRRAVALALLLATALFASLGVGRLGAATFDVMIVGLTFSPSQVTLHTGDTVNWSGVTGTGHTVTSERLKQDGRPLFDSLADFPYTFTEPGTYAYYCRTHRSFGMTGTITVEAVGPPTPVPGQSRTHVPYAPVLSS
jgi:plastocyanin